MTVVLKNLPSTFTKSELLCSLVLFTFIQN